MGPTSKMATRKFNPDRLVPVAMADFVPTPPCVVRSIIPIAFGTDKLIPLVWDPAAGRGHILRTIASHFDVASGEMGSTRICGTDLNTIPNALWPIITNRDYTMEQEVPDGFNIQTPHDKHLITNPPFNLWTEFAENAIKMMKKRLVDKVWLFGRSNLLEGSDRYKRLWSHCPPQKIYQYVGRVQVNVGYTRVMSGAMSFSWFAWERDLLWRTSKKNGWHPPELRFITTDLKSLVRPEDDDFKVKCEACKLLYEPRFPDETGICMDCRKEKPTYKGEWQDD